MTQQNQNNLLIAMFMGYNYHNMRYVYIKDSNTGVNSYIPTEDLQYHTSWDWLMPVYRKIRDIINERSKYDKHTRTEYDLLELDAQMAICEVDIEKAFISIVKFIEWYN